MFPTGCPVIAVDLNTSGRCAGCNGIVRNAPGRRYTVEHLTAVHAVSCPARTVRTGTGR
jgi:hypothetical protein